MAKLDWEKAKRADERKARLRLKSKQVRHGRLIKGAHDRQGAIEAFVAKHEISCLGCSATEAEWAKSGFNSRGAWAVCVPCVKAYHDEKA